VYPMLESVARRRERERLNCDESNLYGSAVSDVDLRLDWNVVDSSASITSNRSFLSFKKLPRRLLRPLRYEPFTEPHSHAGPRTGTGAESDTNPFSRLQEHV